MKNSLFIILLIHVSLSATGQVTMNRRIKKIETYQIEKPEINPIFFTGRVYQGAEGYVYPYPLYDKLTDIKIDKAYNVLSLDNKYVRVDVLPEIGGRIFSAEDKTNHYHFFYTQSGIKPALIGMLGAWLSGGVEWNVPDHHRASSYMPINWRMKENSDSSKTIWVGETELRHRLKWSVGITVYPDRSWIETKSKVINPTSMIQSMLYWANVSVHCNADYQVIFPPDVQFGVDHHKVFFTKWPQGEIRNTGRKNEDLSWWKNFTEGSRSIFAYGSRMNFLAGYDFGKDAGTVHVANRHVVPGKKFFLWGNNPNGEMWNKILSDRDGHYLELMVGAYSDNQPDYSWIQPGEIREFSQIWYPIKGIKGVKNATVDAAVNFEPVSEDKYRVGYCTTKLYQNARVLVKQGKQILLDKTITIDPEHFFLDEFSVRKALDVSDLYTALYDAKGNVLVDYRPIVLEEKPMPEVIKGTKPVKEYRSNEALYLAGLRVDQFNNARLDYMSFYYEALLRDSLDARVNIEVGKHFVRQGEWEKAKRHLLRAQKRLAYDYTVVKNTEALYYLGYVYRMLKDSVAAEEAYWAATWTPEFKHRSFYELAVMAAGKKDYIKALEMIKSSLYVGMRDVQALTLKAYILRMLGQVKEAEETIDYIQTIDPLDYWSAIERSMLSSSLDAWIKSDLEYRNDGIIAVQELLEVVSNYMTIGAVEDAMTVLKAAVAAGNPYASYPMIYYYKAYNLLKLGDYSGAQVALEQADRLSPLNNFPLRIEEIELFETLLKVYPNRSYIHYYLGNLLYYLGQKDEGLLHWKRSVDLNPTFSIACRNLGFAYGRKNKLQSAITYYDMAIKADPNDPLLFTELDKIYEKANVSVERRLKRLEMNKKTVMKHDDAVMRLLTLYNESEQYDKAIAMMNNRHFHLWEGGGRIHRIYADSHMFKGLDWLKRKDYDLALKEFDLANQYPENLEVASSVNGGYEPKIYYFSGIAYERLNRQDKANEYFQMAVRDSLRVGSIELDYFKVKALRKLNNTTKADEKYSDMQKELEKMRKNQPDSYAKFGEENRQIRQSEMKYYEGLLLLLQDDIDAAKKKFLEAVQLYPGNIWAKKMCQVTINNH